MAEYIEKAELIKKLCFETAEWWYSPTIKTINEFPSADVQLVKHGRWLNEYLDENDVWRADCSNCKSECADYFGRISITHKYCEYCGARMDLKDGDTECQ